MVVRYVDWESSQYVGLCQQSSWAVNRVELKGTSIYWGRGCANVHQRLRPLVIQSGLAFGARHKHICLEAIRGCP